MAIRSFTRVESGDVFSFVYTADGPDGEHREHPTAVCDGCGVSGRGCRTEVVNNAVKTGGKRPDELKARINLREPAVSNSLSALEGGEDVGRTFNCGIDSEIKFRPRSG
jgi:hypothetical protein